MISGIHGRVCCRCIQSILVEGRRLVNSYTVDSLYLSISLMPLYGYFRLFSFSNFSMSIFLLGPLRSRDRESPLYKRYKSFQQFKLDQTIYTIYFRTINGPNQIKNTIYSGLSLSRTFSMSIFFLGPLRSRDRESPLYSSSYFTLLKCYFGFL